MTRSFAVTKLHRRGVFSYSTLPPCAPSLPEMRSFMSCHGIQHISSQQQGLSQWSTIASGLLRVVREVFPVAQHAEKYHWNARIIHPLRAAETDGLHIRSTTALLRREMWVARLQNTRNHHRHCHRSAGRDGRTGVDIMRCERIVCFLVVVVVFFSKNGRRVKSQKKS